MEEPNSSGERLDAHATLRACFDGIDGPRATKQAQARTAPIGCCRPWPMVPQRALAWGLALFFAVGAVSTFAVGVLRLYKLVAGEGVEARPRDHVWKWVALACTVLLSALGCRRAQAVVNREISRISSLSMPYFWLFYTPSKLMLLIVIIVASSEANKALREYYASNLVNSVITSVVSVLLLVGTVLTARAAHTWAQYEQGRPHTALELSSTAVGDVYMLHECE